MHSIYRYCGGEDGVFGRLKELCRPGGRGTPTSVFNMAKKKRQRTRKHEKSKETVERYYPGIYLE
jgi:hypothetical protein